VWCIFAAKLYKTGSLKTYAEISTHRLRHHAQKAYSSISGEVLSEKPLQRLEMRHREGSFEKEYQARLPRGH